MEVRRPRVVYASSLRGTPTTRPRSRAVGDSSGEVPRLASNSWASITGFAWELYARREIGQVDRALFLPSDADEPTRNHAVALIRSGRRRAPSPSTPSAPAEASRLCDSDGLTTPIPTAGVGANVHDDPMPVAMSADNARHFWHALMANTVALIDDADTLLAKGSAGRARSLVILAQEELARAQAVYNDAAPIWDQCGGTVTLTPPPGCKAHLSVSRDHREKISATDDYARTLGPFWGDYSMWEDGATAEPARVPAEVDAEKQAGFYVGSAPGKGGRFTTPLDIDPEPIAAEIQRVAQITEMALNEDHTRMKHGPADYDSAQDLHWAVMPYAHPEESADFISRMEAGEAGTD